MMSKASEILAVLSEATKPGWYVVGKKSLKAGKVIPGDALDGPFEKREDAQAEFNDYDKASQKDMTIAYIKKDGSVSRE